MNYLKWFFVVLGIFGLISVRMMEDTLFYDPFLDYFHEANRNAEIPTFTYGKLILSHLFRFGLNLFFSAVIIHFLFLNKKWTVQAAALMILVFLLMLPIYIYCISTHFEVGYQFSFYVRRFVIQPLILLLLVPMFYYRKKADFN